MALSRAQIDSLPMNGAPRSRLSTTFTILEDPLLATLQRLVSNPRKLCMPSSVADCIRFSRQLHKLSGSCVDGAALHKLFEIVEHSATEGRPLRPKSKTSHVLPHFRHFCTPQNQLSINLDWCARHSPGMLSRNAGMYKFRLLLFLPPGAPCYTSEILAKVVKCSLSQSNTFLRKASIQHLLSSHQTGNKPLWLGDYHL